jgi:hypothetical protein
MAPRPSPAERLAGLAFIAFTLMQVPFLVLHSELVPGPSKLLPLAPLQVTAASLAQRLGPRSHLYLTDVLTPGAWVTGALSPFLRCALLGHGAAGSDAGSSSWGRCSVQRSRLLDLQFARAQVRLPLLLALLEGRALGAGQQFVVYGSGLVVLSALFSLYYSVRSAVVGFLLLGAGVYKVRCVGCAWAVGMRCCALCCVQLSRACVQLSTHCLLATSAPRPPLPPTMQGNLVPLPPLVLVAFLCVYAGFSWEKGSGQRTRVGRRQPGVTVKPLATQQQRQPGGQKQATPPQKKQKQKQGRRRA